MVVARAPGKVVLSGAYSVLWGSPAIVTAVDRYVTADTAARADFVTEELRAAKVRSAPSFNALELRRDGLKLGLGSSAAILAACLGALELESAPGLDDTALSARVLDRALIAHREAQGGGSGIDVATSCRGGTLLARLLPSHLSTERLCLPPGIVLGFLAAPEPASTPALLARVHQLEQCRPEEHRRLMLAQFRAAELAALACRAGQPEEFLSALAAQSNALFALGEAADAPIVTPAVRELSATALLSRAVVLPGGAGGGDIAVYAGLQPPPRELISLAERHSHVDLGLTWGARGLHAARPRC